MLTNYINLGNNNILTSSNNNQSNIINNNPFIELFNEPSQTSNNPFINFSYNFHFFRNFWMNLSYKII